MSYDNGYRLCIVNLEKKFLESMQYRNTERDAREEQNTAHVTCTKQRKISCIQKQKKEAEVIYEKNWMKSERQS